MKTILALSCTVLLAACGGSNETPASGAGGAGATGGPGGSAGTVATGEGGSSTAGAGVAGSGGAAGAAVGGTTGSAGTGGGGSAGQGSGNAGSAGSNVGGAGGSGGAGGAAGSAGAAGAACPASDPLKTKSAKVDAYDCAVLAEAAKWGMPDPMIVKSQIQQESSFDVFAVSGDSPCGIKQGWTDAESKSFGLIQTTPACGEAKSALLPDGHPNLTKDMTSALWATSVFNPTINLDEGVKTDVDSLKALEAKYPGCTAIQYNMMAAGAFNSGTGAITGCGGYNARAQAYVTAITAHYHQFATAAGWPDPY
jgi:hypothetical protein